MSATALLERLSTADVRLRVDGEHLRVNAPKGALTPELKAELLAHKPELLRILADQQLATVAAPVLLLPADMGGYCPTHRRWLSYPEQRAGACTWCRTGLPLYPAQPDHLLPRPLACLGCGAELLPERIYRCLPCVEQAALAIVAMVECEQAGLEVST
ncbi:MAG: hypothetical protein HY690_01050 [Chloroflexi bacterium]|nr:hypothetical protein [Chloroflexota bacterium]